ncbi:hypothetical protein GCM10010329_26600 [Streptomyces spiroverticillatus]|uniref:Uncharacterized protein n=1 Tax=Streptomyces finlayi TaxID=67296 RepID=A0A918WVH6_9ACTN|nr:Ig-like domain-containing protein [Streptomyces finlayi]GHA03081.1 hypothetical protein GCM10010329_26600 [Streptomyces spiroverticillatus]GHC87268.1 hypothetical protein GCM10010334_19010 [Streptomyces finlayi]
MNHLITRASAIRPGSAPLAAHVTLTSDCSAPGPLAPGSTVEFELSLTTEGEGHRYFGYLMTDSFVRVADVMDDGGLKLLASQDRYALSAGPGESTTATFRLRIHDAPGDAVLAPALRAGLIDSPGVNLTHSTHSIVQERYRVTALPPQGRKLVVPPGTTVSVGHLTDGLPQGVRLVGVGSAGHGLVTIATDDSVVYAPDHGYRGYDKIPYSLRTGNGSTVRGQVTLFVGDLHSVPGVLA